MATVTYNRAIDAYCAGQGDEFRKLGGYASEFAGFVDDGGALARMIRGKVGELVDADAGVDEEDADGEEEEDGDEGDGTVDGAVDDEDNTGIAGLGGEVDDVL